MGSGSNIHKSTWERKYQQKTVTRTQYEGWASSLLSEVKMGPRVIRTLFLIIKVIPGWLSNKFYSSFL